MIASQLNVYRNKLGNSDVKQGLFSFHFLSGASVASKNFVTIEYIFIGN